MSKEYTIQVILGVFLSSMMVVVLGNTKDPDIIRLALIALVIGCFGILYFGCQIIR